MSKLKYSAILEHYMKYKVCKEIYEFSRDRWVALHCEKEFKKKKVFVRYIYAPYKELLKITKPSDIFGIINYYKELKPRTFYASILQFKRILYVFDVLNPANVYSCLPTWDVDNTISKFEATLKAAENILDALRKEKVEESVFLKWSGEGLHIHLHPKAITKELKKKIHPLDAAYSLVEYIKEKVAKKIQAVSLSYQANKLVVENIIHSKSVITAPLTFHREQDRIAVCIDPSEVNNFSLDWTEPKKFKHFWHWKEKFKQGEADKLVLKSYKKIGSCPYRFKPPKKKGKPVDKWITEFLKTTEEKGSDK